MNPMTNMKNIKKLSEQELQRSFKTTWHDQYRNSAWIFVGGLPYDLSEGDIICIFSQYGEIVNINLVRDKDTGKQKGFCFVCYEDQRSTDLAVDNFNGIKILGRTIRVDHVSDYKMPKDSKNTDAETKKLREEGCAPGVKVEKRPQMPIPSSELPAFAKEEEAPPDGFKLPPRLPICPIKIEKEDGEELSLKKVKVKKEKKHKKDKKKKIKKKHKKKQSSSSESSSDSSEGSSSDDDSDSEDEKHSKKSKNKSNKLKKNRKKSVSDSEEEKRNKKHENEKDNESYLKKNNDLEERDTRKFAGEQREGRKYYNSREEYLKYKKEERYDEKRNDKYEDRRYQREYDRTRRQDYERNDRKREYDKKDQDKNDFKRYRR